MIRIATFDVGRLCFEITETAAITHLTDARRLIDDVRALGVKVALDDFGAGASSFVYLKSLPVDFLKIDGHFVTNVLDNEIDNAAVRCFCEVAKVVGVKTIAEFVEHDAVRDELRALGVDMAQGFLIHQPEPLTRLLSNVPREAPFMSNGDGGSPLSCGRASTELAADAPRSSALDLEDPAEMMLWADALSISMDRLRDIVSKVGPMRAAIRCYVMAEAQMFQ